ncbi:MAG: hypothetical protein GEU96_09160 [Propionibacteriales bacterium]|nr:hypothetical protein [Propionibacteriales bacterium]
MHTRPTLLAGTGLALAFVCAVAFDAAFGLGVDQVVLIGGVLGAVLGLMPSKEPRWQLAGFGTGLGAAWVSYGLRAAVLPDAPTGSAMAAGGAVVICVLVAVATSDRVPLWAGLLGIAAMAGTFEHTFDPATSRFMADSLAAVSTAGLAAALGYLAAVVVGSRFKRIDPGPVAYNAPAPTWDEILSTYKSRRAQ